MYDEEGSVALRVLDSAGVNGFSIFNVQCAICPIPSDQDSLLIVVGNQTRYGLQVMKSCRCGPTSL